MNPLWLADAKKHSAYHESGHVVMAMAFDCHVSAVFIKPDTDGGQTSIIPPPSNSSTNLVRLTLLAAAGVGAEKAFFRGVIDEMDGVFLGFGSDESAAFAPLEAMGQSGHFMDYTEIAAALFNCEPYREIIQDFAEMLLKRGFISEQKIFAEYAARVPIIDGNILETFIKRAFSKISHSPND